MYSSDGDDDGFDNICASSRLSSMAMNEHVQHRKACRFQSILTRIFRMLA
jgi:hypothetical protein